MGVDPVQFRDSAIMINESAKLEDHRDLFLSHETPKLARVFVTPTSIHEDHPKYKAKRHLGCVVVHDSL